MPPRPPLYRARGVRSHREHKAAHDKRRGSSTARGYDRQWRKVRALKLTITPLCERCTAVGVVTLATTVDHRVPLEQWPEGRLVMTNLESQCDHHHNVIKQREEAEWRGSGKPGWLEPSRIPLELVCGPIASGKSWWVRQHAGPRDLVVDMDAIASRIAGLPFTHSWDRRHLDDALRERNALLAALSRDDATSRWPMAWLIVSEPTASGREWWCDRLEPRRVTVLETPPAICLERVRRDPDRAARFDHASHAIAAWWSAYEPRDGEHAVRP